MSKNVAIWQVNSDGPRRLLADRSYLEEHLESWIERDPGLIQPGLLILGRQVSIDAGRIDLVGIDPQGRWCIVELKQSALDRAAIAQGLDYAACFAELDEASLRDALRLHLTHRSIDLDAVLRQRNAAESLDPGSREVLIHVVGTVASPGLERMMRFLSRNSEVHIYATFLDVFMTPAGERLLVREVTQDENQPSDDRAAASLEQIRAATGSLSAVFDVLKAAADRHGLRARPWKRCVMFTPPSDARRCLFTVGSKGVDNALRLYVYADGFREFFPDVDLEKLKVIPSGDQTMDIDQARTFARQLDELLAPPAANDALLSSTAA